MLMAAVFPLTGGCLPIGGDAIKADDLSPAIPAFGQAAGHVLSPAPLAGAQRTFSRSELLRIGRRLGLSEANAADWPTTICFAQPLSPLARERVAAAIQQSVGPAIAFQLLDYSRYPVPPGELRFQNVGLQPDRPDGSRLISGSVVYASGRRSPIWARVRSLTKPSGLVAARELRAGVPLDRADSQLTELTLRAADSVSSAPELDGMVPRRTIARGTALKLSMFTRLREITPGETVTVRIRSGSARLALESQAETGGYTGDLILFRNPISGQKFRARVDGPARASVDLSAKENQCCR